MESEGLVSIFLSVSRRAVHALSVKNTKYQYTGYKCIVAFLAIHTRCCQIDVYTIVGRAWRKHEIFIPNVNIIKCKIKK